MCAAVGTGTCAPAESSLRVSGKQDVLLQRTRREGLRPVTGPGCPGPQGGGTRESSQAAVSTGSLTVNKVGDAACFLTHLAGVLLAQGDCSTAVEGPATAREPSTWDLSPDPSHGEAVLSAPPSPVEAVASLGLSGPWPLHSSPRQTSLLEAGIQAGLCPRPLPSDHQGPGLGDLHPDFCLHGVSHVACASLCPGAFLCRRQACWTGPQSSVTSS